MPFEKKIIPLAIIVSALAIALTLVTVSFDCFFISKSNKVYQEKPEIVKESNCVKEGVYVDHFSKDSFVCCKNLSKASALPLDENCEVLVPENSPGIEPGWTCINCGDGVCNDQDYENFCNCPGDCGERKMCGPSRVGEDYDLNYCDLFCNTSKDCRYSCGCGAITINETCHDGDAVYDCVDTNIECRGNRCVITGEEDETANWQNYTNPDLGYEFKYPPGWSSTEVTADSPGKKFYITTDGITYWISTGYISLESMSVMGITYCGAYPENVRCENYAISGSVRAAIDWGIKEDGITRANAWISSSEGGIVTLDFKPVTEDFKPTIYKILKSFKSINEESYIDALLYEKRSSWGPCANPEGGCWENQFLYSDGRLITETKNGKEERRIDIESLGAIINYIRDEELLTKDCEAYPVLDVYNTYIIYLDGMEKKVTFPGCEEEFKEISSMLNNNVN